MEKHKMRGERRCSDLMDIIHLSPFKGSIQLRITTHESRVPFPFCIHQLLEGAT